MNDRQAPQTNAPPPRPVLTTVRRPVPLAEQVERLKREAKEAAK